MPKIVGRVITLSLDATVVAAARTKSLTINNSPINVTTDDEGGIQALLDVPGEKAVEISVDGILDTDALLTLSLDANPEGVMVFTYPTYTITGTFFMSSYSEGIPYNEATTFTAAFSSSGAVVKAVIPIVLSGQCQ